MKVLLLVLFLFFSGLNFGAHATEQDDSSPIMESKFPESLETELDSVNDGKSDDVAFREKRSQGTAPTPFSRFPTGSPFSRFPTGSPFSRFPTGSPFSRFPTGSPFSRFPTGSPFSRFPTRSPLSTDRPLRCYHGSSGSKRDVFKRVQVCSRRHNMCFFVKGTLRSGQVVNGAGCVGRNESCQRQCNKSLRSGRATHCSIRCCFDDLCNDGARRPTARHRVILRVIWKLLRATKSIIEALTFLLKFHMNQDRARGYKREITSMMAKVDFHEQQLEDSRDSEVLRVKQDVSETRMRAQAIIKKLDEFIGEYSNDDSKK